MKPTILVIAQSLGQPRVQRRVRAMVRYGFTVRVYGFHRGLYGDQHIHPDVETVNFGNPGISVSIRRALIIFSAARQVRKSEKGRRADFLYCFGFDSLIINWLAFPSKRLFGYEISDLMFWKGKSILADIFCSIENYFLRHTSIVTLTSPYFKEELASRVPEISKKCIVLENKIPQEVASSFSRPPLYPYPFSRGRLKIGFVGAVNYIELFKRIICGIGECPDALELHIFGYSHWLDELTECCSKHDNVYYHGPFKNPDDLPRAYSALELSLILYDSSDYNVRVAVPNKLFESIYFRVPVLAASNTSLGNRVEKWQVGFTVDDRSSDAVGQFFGSITREKIASMRNSMGKQSLEGLIVDMQPLFQRIEYIVGEV